MGKKYLNIVVAILFLGFFASLFIARAYAATNLTSVSDTVSTSRPSASTPLVNNATTSDIQETIFDNKSVFLASDSAIMYIDPSGESGSATDTGINVASMSAASTPSSGQRIVYFTNNPGHAHHAGDVLAVPITAMHTIVLKTQSQIPVGGKIILTFPTSSSSDTNQASPSASTFMFNNLSTSNIKVNFSTGSTTCTLAISGTAAGSAPTITCTIATALVSSGTTVTFLVGCSANTTTTCNTQVPTLINPTRNPGDSLAGAGVATTQADNWKVNITTQDNNSVTLDTGRAIIGIIESVQVQANIDPTLTFTIAGIGSGVALNSGHGSSCPSESTNTGITSTATFVNLGTVGTNINLAAQDITVSTNAAGGYVLSATSSGQLQDVQNGYSVNSSTTPGYVAAGTELFGIHPCGTDAASSFNPTGPVCHGGVCTGSGSGTDGKVAWPTSTSPLTLASRTSVANAIITTIEYALTANATTPAGQYGSVITYVATPTFN